MIKSIVLSAGKGTRMKSPKPKVLQPVLGYEMINHVLKALSEAQVQENLLVVGYKADEVLSSIDPAFPFDSVIQSEQLGTGHAVRIAKEKISKEIDDVIITCGDTPLISGKTYKNLIDFHKKQENDLTILTTEFEDATGYGRIVREDGKVNKIVEQKDASESEKEIKEVNTGVYVINAQKLFDKIDLIDSNNAQNEYYLTDIIKIFIDNNYKVDAFKTKDSNEVMGVNDLVALEKVTKYMKEKINNNLLESGVQLIDKTNTYIGPNVQIAEGVTIYPGNTILGNVSIGSSTTLMPNNTIIDSTIGQNVTVGPMAYLRNNTIIGNDCRIGNYVEVKNSVVGNGTKAAHLTYIGDAIVGSNVNFGCGVIIANYDGEKKHQTTIGENVFIGSNSNIISPAIIGSDTFIAAGTTVAKEVEAGKFIMQKRDNKIVDNKKIK